MYRLERAGAASVACSFPRAQTIATRDTLLLNCRAAMRRGIAPASPMIAKALAAFACWTSFALVNAAYRRGLISPSPAARICEAREGWLQCWSSGRGALINTSIDRSDEIARRKRVAMVFGSIGIRYRS